MQEALSSSLKEAASNLHTTCTGIEGLTRAPTLLNKLIIIQVVSSSRLHRDVEKMEKSVLFLCEDRTLRESFSLFLSEWYPASCIRSFEEFETHMKEHGGALLLVDLFLSEEVTRRIIQIKKSYPHLLIIFMTVYQEAAVHLEARLRSHVDAWFYKPVDIEEIRKSVASLLGQRNEHI